MSCSRSFVLRKQREKISFSFITKNSTVSIVIISACLSSCLSLFPPSVLSPHLPVGLFFFLTFFFIYFSPSLSSYQVNAHVPLIFATLTIFWFYIHTLFIFSLTGHLFVSVFFYPVFVLHVFLFFIHYIYLSFSFIKYKHYFFIFVSLNSVFFPTYVELESVEKR